MFGQDQLQELLNLESNGDKIVSLYLDADSAQESIETIKLRVRGMLKEAQIADNEGSALIERFLDHSYDWSKPGLALFTSTGGAFLHTYPTAVAFSNRLQVGHKPYVKPLAHLLEHYSSYGVILVDRVGARFFEFHLGELQSSEGFMGEDVRKLKKGGGSSAVGMRGGVGGARHEQEAVQRNLREAAVAAGQFFEGAPVRRVFIGGTAETVAQFRELLSKKLQSQVGGTFAMDMNAGEHEVSEKSLKLLKEANAKRELALVDKLIAARAQGGNAVVGLDESLQAISERRVETLVVSEGFHTPGYIHEESSLAVANLARSPLGNDELTEVDDVVDSAISFTIAQGGQVEVISGQTDLETAGNIGALLRY